MTTSILPTTLRITSILLASYACADAVVIDLTAPNPAGTQGTIANVIFRSGNFETATGTGNFHPFVRLQTNVTEEGFNSGNAALMPDVKDAREVFLSTLTTVSLAPDGPQYVQLALDLGEPSNINDSEISLVDLRIFVRSTPILNATNTTELFTGTPIFSFGAGDRVDLDQAVIGGGNGNSDMFVYLPVSLFSGFQGTDRLYLYSKLGGTERPPFPSEGTFEEWGVLTGGTPLIPEPTTALFGLGIAGCVTFGRRRRRAVLQ